MSPHEVLARVQSVVQRSTVHRSTVWVPVWAFGLGTIELNGIVKKSMTTNDDRLTLRLPPHPIEGEGIGKHGPIICPGHPLTLVVRVSKMPRMATLTIAILKVLNIRVKP